jgi:hypothetical protein
MADTTPFLVAQRDMEPLLADMMVDASIGCSGDVEAALEDQHAEDEDVYKMKEILQEMPQDVIQYIEAEGVVKLGEFEAQVLQLPPACCIVLLRARTPCASSAPDRPSDLFG